jgi:hypothetical protein
MRPGVPADRLRNLLVAAAFAAAAGCGGVGHAAPFFTVTGGTTFDTFLDSFAWVGPRFGDDEVLLWDGGILGLSEPGVVTLEYIGKAALNADNIFRWNGVQIFTTGPGGVPNLIKGQTAATPFPPVALESYVVPGVVPAGTVPFSFFITTGTPRAVPNDGNLDIAFWPIPGTTSPSPINFSSVVYAMLDDEDVSDSDHDDMIVRLTVAPVPEPATLAGAATGLLGGLWLVRRRNQAAGGPRRLSG